MFKNYTSARIASLLGTLALAAATLACGLPAASTPASQSPTQEAQASVPTQASLPASPKPICDAIPQEVLEQVMGRAEVGSPQPFQDASMGDGCAYDFGSDSAAAYFVYVTFASEAQFNAALASAVRPEPVTTVGDSAFLNYGADARQLWVRSGDQAVLVAIGDRENVAGMLTLAPYLLAALP